MPRPKQCRRVCLSPNCTYFKPAGIPTSALEEVVVAVDELEAMRLVDVDGIYYEQAAEQMRVSRRTFGRIIDSARRKVAQALIQGMALRIEGGVIEMAEQRTFCCGRCEHEWRLPFGTGRPSGCPQCQSKNFRRVQEERGCGGKRKARVERHGKAAASLDEAAQTEADSDRKRKRQRKRRRALTEPSRRKRGRPLSTTRTIT
jgi:predicted DNA-binding protein (UPF0251 family)